MAVQKSRKTRAKRGQRRAHNHLTDGARAIDSVTGELHRRHHMTDNGYYRGRQIIAVNHASEEE